MSVRWFLARNNVKYGPYSLDQLRSMVGTGHIIPADMLLQEGTQKWVSASAVLGVFASTEAAVQQPSDAPQADGERRGPLDRALAIAALISVFLWLFEVPVLRLFAG